MPRTLRLGQSMRYRRSRILNPAPHAPNPGTGGNYLLSPLTGDRLLSPITGYYLTKAT